MAAVGLIAFTILVGVLLLGDLGPGSKPAGLVGAHLGLAALAATVVCLGALGGTSSVVKAGATASVVTAAVGIALYRRLQSRSDHKVSRGLLIAHGAGAALTIAFSIVAALR